MNRLNLSRFSNKQLREYVLMLESIISLITVIDGIRFAAAVPAFPRPSLLIYSNDAIFCQVTVLVNSPSSQPLPPPPPNLISYHHSRPDRNRTDLVLER